MGMLRILSLILSCANQKQSEYKNCSFLGCLVTSDYKFSNPKTNFRDMIYIGTYKNK